MKRREFVEKTSQLFFTASCLGLSSTLFWNKRDSTPDPLSFKLASSLREGSVNGIESFFYTPLSHKQVRCDTCFRECVIEEGRRGFCRVRENTGGVLYNLVYGRPAIVQQDWIDREPLHHYLPGAQCLCIGTASCNFRCKFCHNWTLSQKDPEEVSSQEMTPGDIVQAALDAQMPALAFTFNEPTVFFEYMHQTAQLAQEAGLGVLFHSNGALKSEPLQLILKEVDAVVIDLKAFTHSFYQDVTQGSLAPVLQTLELIKEKGVWLELVNLVISPLNDHMNHIKEMCQWIYRALGPETPIHFTRFFPSYLLTHLPPTPVPVLEEAATIAQEEGLEYVYIGNVPGHPMNAMYCPACGEKVIERHHFTVSRIQIEGGRCQYCMYKLPGIWESS